MSEYDFQPGDVWIDTALRGYVHTDGVHWHVRLDGAGEVELYEPNGPGLVPAADIRRIRGGMRLLSRAVPEMSSEEMAGHGWGDHPDCAAKGCDIPEGYSECRRCGAEAVEEAED